MNRTAFIAALTTLSACNASMESDTAGNRIMTEETYRAAVVGRIATGEGTSIIANADGTFSGTSPRGAVTGRWNWQDGYFCRTASVAGEPLEPDCQVVTLDGSTISYIRDQGRGETITYTLG